MTYRDGAITRDIVLLVASPGCGASLFVRVLRVASVKEQIEDFTHSAVNIAAGEGTVGDWLTVTLTPVGILADLRGLLTFCFVPGTPGVRSSLDNRADPAPAEKMRSWNHPMHQH